MSAPLTAVVPQPECRSAVAAEVVRIALDVDVETVRSRATWLSDDERERASRFRFERDRRRFIACRGALRALLGARLGVSPRGILFRYGPHGKPELSGRLTGAMAFNVSHSEDLALCALSRQGALGVDVERVRAVPELERIAERFFSWAERAYVCRHEQGRDERFFRIWTLKEAWVKGVGVGLADSLPELCVVSEASPVGDSDSGHSPIMGWNLRTFQPVRVFVAGLATRGHVALRLSEWTD